MKKWSLRLDPGAHDPARYVLLVEGEMKHMAQIVKKFGAMCGRPVKVDHPEGFNFRVYLRGMTPARLEKISRHLEEVAPGACANRPAAVEKKPPEAAIASGAGENSLQEPALGVIEPQARAVPVKPPPTAIFIPGMAVSRQKEAKFVPISAKPLWGLESSLNPQQNFDNFTVGPGNRFAHAAITSVVGSPGTMYNPLFIYGVPGCGKTHILHALAQALGGGPLILTTGPTLAGAVARACAAGRLGEIEAMAAGVKALLVDDVHLMEVSEKNKPALAKIFQSFFERSRQVVFTSLYAPRALAALEEALKISFSKGWAVDMKLPAAVVQMDVMAALAQRCGAPLNLEGIKKLHESEGFHYGGFPKLVARWKVLDELGRSGGRAPAEDDILSQLINSGERLSSGELPLETELAAAEGFVAPKAGPDALPLAYFFPKGQEAMMAWVVARFHGIAAKFGIHRSYREALREAYDADRPFGVPFAIGESCRRSEVCAALVLGPGKDFKLAAQSGAFAHAVEHILQSFGVAAGWIPFEESVVTRPFLAAHLDFLVFHP